MSTSKFLFFLAALVLFVPSGCGGGGDNGNDDGSRTGIGGIVVDGNPYSEENYFRPASPLPTGRANAKVFVYTRTGFPGTKIAETISEANGRFFVSLPPGEYSIYAQRPPSAPDPQFCATGDVIEVTADETAEIALGHADCDRLIGAGLYEYL